MRDRRKTHSNLIADLTAVHVPLAVARAEAMRVEALKRSVDEGRITISDLRAQLRGAA